jgi:hypothetical protein
MASGHAVRVRPDPLPMSLLSPNTHQGTTMARNIFVFGSNLAGRHGKGAALTARTLHGAIYGQGIGLQGNSYAIPTKDYQLHSLPLLEIEQHVKTFIRFANYAATGIFDYSDDEVPAHIKALPPQPELVFNVTRIGCGLAGYTDAQIAPFFRGAPLNCNLPEGWRQACK